MKKLAVAVLILGVLGAVKPASAQKAAPPAETAMQKLEKLLKDAEMPFTKREDNSYVAVITMDDNDSERFEIFMTNLGEDQNDPKWQTLQMYFLLGRLPKDATVPAALKKEIDKWNGNLTMGKVVVVDNVILYTTSSWLVFTGAELLVRDAVMGHMTAKGLRKEVGPYLKQ